MPSGSINFLKRRQTSTVIREIQRYQIDGYNFTVVEPIVDLLGIEFLLNLFLE